MCLEGAWADDPVVGKIAGLHLVPPLKLAFLSGREVGGLRGVAMKCRVMKQNYECEGVIPGPN